MAENNHKGQQVWQTVDHQQPHDGLRKVSMGLATVLLGTSVYFGFNPTVASAAANVLGNTGDGKVTDNSAHDRIDGSAVALSSTSSTDQNQTGNSTSAVNGQDQSNATAAGNESATNNETQNGGSQASDQSATQSSANSSANQQAPKAAAVKAQIHKKTDKQADDHGQQARTVDRTIYYYYSDGRQARQPHTDSLEFDHHVSVDQQSGRVLNDQWSPAQDFADVQSPHIDGFVATPAVISNKGIEHDHGPIVETVIYSPIVQHLTYSVVDDTTGKTLVEPTTLFSGRANTALPSEINVAYETIRHSWLTQGYRFDLTKADSRGYDLLPEKLGENAEGSQNITIYLVHDQKTDTNQVEVPRTVNYVFSNGEQAAVADVDQPLVFKQSRAIDAVTNRVIAEHWSPKTQSFPTLPAPQIAGYKPDTPAINDNNIQHNQGPIVKTVIYTPVNPDKPVTQKLTYSVVDDVDGQTLVDQAPLASGGSGSPIPETAQQIYEYVRQSWIAQGYRLDPAKGNGRGYDSLPERFDNNASTDQNVTVYLVHNQHQTTSEKQVPRRILYYFADGRVASPAHVDKPLTFSERRVTDAVTGQLVRDDWTPTSQDFTAVTSPTIDGFHADKAVVENTNVTHKQGPITEIVTYIPDQQMLTYSVIDDTSGQTLVNAAPLTDGELNSQVSAQVGKNYQQMRSYWLSHGYALDTAKADGRGYDQLPDHFGKQKGRHNLNVYLVHTYSAVNADHPHSGVNQLEYQRAVHETVNYDGAGGQTPSPVVQAATVSRTVTLDNTTGEVVPGGQFDTQWSVDGKQDDHYNSVVTPMIPGYTADQTSIPAKQVTGKDQSYLVKYQPQGQVSQPSSTSAQAESTSAAKQDQASATPTTSQPAVAPEPVAAETGDTVQAPNSAEVTAKAQPNSDGNDSVTVEVMPAGQDNNQTDAEGGIELVETPSEDLTSEEEPAKDSNDGQESTTKATKQVPTDNDSVDLTLSEGLMGLAQAN